MPLHTVRVVAFHPPPQFALPTVAAGSRSCLGQPYQTKETRMNRLVSKSHPVAETPQPPLLLIVTITTTPTLFAYSLCGPLELQHRHVQPCDLGPNDGLIAAIVRALATLTPARANRLVAAHQATGSLPITPKDSRSPLLPISVRTENRDLIAAGEFLQTEAPQTPADASTPLQKHLQRFDIEWQQLPLDAPLDTGYDTGNLRASRDQ